MNKNGIDNIIKDWIVELPYNDLTHPNQIYDIKYVDEGNVFLYFERVSKYGREVMSKRTIQSIFDDIYDLWAEAWRNQIWRKFLFVHTHISIPKPDYPSRKECIEVMYWEPQYHPINALMEADKTLEKIHKELFQKYVEFANQDREVARIIREVIG